MISVMFIPILILLAIVTMVTVFISKNSKIGLGRGKAGKWMLMGYTALLLLSTMTFILLPVAQTESETTQSDEDWEQKANEFYDAVHAGDLHQLESEWLIEEWSFPYNERELFINAPNNDVEGVNILVERTDELEDSIDVKYYQTPIFINGHEVEEEYHPEVNLVTPELVIYPGTTKHLQYKMFGTEFPFNQFNGKEDIWGESTISDWNGTALYIRIPSNVDIQGDEYNYTVVDPS